MYRLQYVTVFTAFTVVTNYLLRGVTLIMHLDIVLHLLSSLSCTAATAVYREE